jgi:hypothetical protein
METQSVTTSGDWSVRVASPRDVMDYFMSVSTIQFVSTNLTNRQFSKERASMYATLSAATAADTDTVEPNSENGTKIWILELTWGVHDIGTLCTRRGDQGDSE